MTARPTIWLAVSMIAAWCGPGIFVVSASAAPPAFTSTIQSRTTSSCFDVPGGTTDINTDVVGRACTGSVEQRFRFEPVAARPGTYRIVNRASTLCLAQYRFGVRQAPTCTYPPPNVTYPMWDLDPVNAAADTFQLEPTSQEGSSMPRCVDVHVVTGSADRALALDFCADNTPAQVFTIPGIP